MTIFFLRYNYWHAFCRTRGVVLIRFVGKIDYLNLINSSSATKIPFKGRLIRYNMMSGLLLNSKRWKFKFNCFEIGLEWHSNTSRDCRLNFVRRRAWYPERFFKNVFLIHIYVLNILVLYKTNPLQFTPFILKLLILNYLLYWSHL